MLYPLSYEGVSAAWRDAPREPHGVYVIVIAGSGGAAVRPVARRVTMRVTARVPAGDSAEIADAAFPLEAIVIGDSYHVLSSMRRGGPVVVRTSGADDAQAGAAVLGAAVDMGSIIANRAAIAPRRPAITFEGRTITYGEFIDRIDRTAAELRAGGVGRGDRVGYVGANHPAFLEVLYATARLGAIFVPMNFRLAAEELAYIIADAQIHTLVADPERAAVVESVRRELPLRRTLCITALQDPAWQALDALVRERPPLADPVAPGPEDIALIMYTSGTTGSPKGAMLTHGNLFWNSVGAAFGFDVLSTDVSLVCAPLFHIGGLNVTTLITLQKCGHIILTPGFDPAQALRLIAEHKVTTMFGVPAMLQFMAGLPEFDETDLSSMRFLVVAGAPVPAPLVERYQARGLPITQGYGLTETSPLVAILGVDEMTERRGAAGHRLTLISETRVLDGDGAPVPAGERGEVCVRGPQVMAGYWRKPEATAAAIDADGWFHTGDMGELDEDGYVYIVDRVKDMLITGGENVYPAEVETVLYGHPAVAEVAVIGLPDEKWGEAVTAVVAPRAGESVTLDELRDYARGRLAGFKIPLRMELVDELPRGGSGKVLKFRLRARYGAQ